MRSIHVSVPSGRHRLLDELAEALPFFTVDRVSPNSATFVLGELDYEEARTLVLHEVEKRAPDAFVAITPRSA